MGYCHECGRFRVLIDRMTALCRPCWDAWPQRDQITTTGTAR